MPSLQIARVVEQTLLKPGVSGLKVIERIADGGTVDRHLALTCGKGAKGGGNSNDDAHCRPFGNTLANPDRLYRDTVHGPTASGNRVPLGGSMTPESDAPNHRLI